MIERADRQTSPLVEGRFYLVPTVRAQWWGKVADWPVIGPLHNDGKIFHFKADHYHVDARFLPRRWRKLYQVFTSPLSALVLPAPVMRRRKCVRAHLEYFVDLRRDTSPLDVLRTMFAGQQCPQGKGGWICPHQKASLGSIKPVDGIITCPLHGLRIDAASGRVLA
jgi:hypothetical protein